MRVATLKLQISGEGSCAEALAVMAKLRNLENMNR